MSLPQTLDLETDRVVGLAPAVTSLVQWYPRLRAWSLSGNWLRIGREPGCDVLIDDAATSRVHARIRCSGDEIVIEDLDSRNGVFVSGRRIYGTAPLYDGQVLRIARALFTVRRLTDLSPECGGDAYFAACLGAEPTLPTLVGRLGLRDVHRNLRALARQEEPVLILGETGTGKSAAAAALAAASGKRLYVVTGPELRPENALSALFGHVRGAFTGADRARDGYVKLAAGQMLFLDEVGDLPPDVQSMLLGLLQDGRYRPLGADVDQRATCRIVAATSLDLRARVEAGLFRADLFHRLDRRRIELPPLRDRIEDLAELVRAILERTHGVVLPIEGLDPLVLERLAVHRWPGNVRELENVVGKSFDASSPGALSPHRVQRCLEREAVGVPVGTVGSDGPVGTLPSASVGTVPSAPRPGTHGRKLGPAQIADAIARAGGNRARAARLLGIGRATLYRRLEAVAPRSDGTRSARPDAQESSETSDEPPHWRAASIHHRRAESSPETRARSSR